MVLNYRLLFVDFLGSYFGWICPVLNVGGKLYHFSQRRIVMLRIRRHSSRMLFAASNIMGYYTNGGSSGCYSTIRSDPITLLLSKGCQLNTLSPQSCSTFVSGRGRGRGGIAVDIGFNGNNLKLKGCLREEDIDAVAFHKGKGKGNGKGNHPRSFAPPHLQLLRVRHFEIGLQESTSTTDDAAAAVIQNQQGASHHGSPLGLTDRPLPNKIVVAVDVDEGNYFSPFSLEKKGLLLVFQDLIYNVLFISLLYFPH